MCAFITGLTVYIAYIIVWLRDVYVCLHHGTHCVYSIHHCIVDIFMPVPSSQALSALLGHTCSAQEFNT